MRIKHICALTNKERIICAGFLHLFTFPFVIEQAGIWSRSGIRSIDLMLLNILNGLIHLQKITLRT